MPTRKSSVLEQLLNRFEVVQDTDQKWKIYDKHYVSIFPWFWRISSKNRQKIKRISDEFQCKSIVVLRPVVSKFVRYKTGRVLVFISEKQAKAHLEKHFFDP